MFKIRTPDLADKINSFEGTIHFHYDQLLDDIVKLPSMHAEYLFMISKEKGVPMDTCKYLIIQ